MFTHVPLPEASLAASTTTKDNRSWLCRSTNLPPRAYTARRREDLFLFLLHPFIPFSKGTMLLLFLFWLTHCWMRTPNPTQNLFYLPNCLSTMAVKQEHLSYTNREDLRSESRTVLFSLFKQPPIPFFTYSRKSATGSLCRLLLQG